MQALVKIVNIYVYIYTHKASLMAQPVISAYNSGDMGDVGSTPVSGRSSGGGK